MKFDSPDGVDLLKRLTMSPDFNHYLDKLVADYEKAIESLLYAPPGQAECKRGEAKALFLLLQTVGRIK